MAPRSPAAEGQTPCSSTTSTFPVPSASISDTSAISGAVPTVPHGPVADGHLNVCSIVHKREQLEHLLNNSNINFLGLTETWLSSSSPEAVITMWDYRVFRKDRDRGKGGGVLLYVKNPLNCCQIELPREIDIECVVVNISLSAKMYCHLHVS